VQKIMADKEKAAYYKGYNNFKNSNGQCNPNPISELTNPTYAPSSGHEEAYKAGWDQAKQEKNK
jgi:hypothetical protein